MNCDCFFLSRVKHNFSVWLRTGSNPSDFNRFRSDTGKDIIWWITNNYLPVWLMDPSSLTNLNPSLVSKGWIIDRKLVNCETTITLSSGASSLMRINSLIAAFTLLLLKLYSMLSSFLSVSADTLFSSSSSSIGSVASKSSVFFTSPLHKGHSGGFVVCITLSIHSRQYIWEHSVMTGDLKSSKQMLQSSVTPSL